MSDPDGPGADVPERPGPAEDARLPGPCGLPVTPAGRHRTSPPPGRRVLAVEAWAHAWRASIWPGVRAPMSFTEAGNALRRLTGELWAAAHAERFDGAGIQVVGAELVACRFTGADTLGLTLRVAIEQLSAAAVAPGRVAAVIEELGTGYLNARTDTLLAEQEVLRQVWIQTHRCADAAQPATGAAAAGTSVFHAVFQLARTPMCVTDPGGRIIEANTAFADVVGRDARACALRMLHETVDERDSTAVATARSRLRHNERGAVDVDVRARHRDGHGVRLRLTLHAHHDEPTGRGPAILVTAVDTTREHALHALLADHDRRDPLTFLPDRRGFEQLLTDAFADGWAHIRVCGIYLEDFATVNAAIGYAAADAVLREFAERLQQALGDHGTACRLTGAAFVVLLGPTAHRSDAAQLGTMLRAALAHPVRVDNREVRLSATTAFLHTTSSGGDPARLAATVVRQLVRPGPRTTATS